MIVPPSPKDLTLVVPLTVPDFIVSPPVKVFTPDNVSVPVPDMVTLPAPLPIIPEILVFPVPLIVKLLLLLETVAPTVNVLLEAEVQVCVVPRVTALFNVTEPVDAFISIPELPIVSAVVLIVKDAVAVLPSPTIIPATLLVPALG